MDEPRRDGGFTVETVKQPNDGDWTSAVIAAIDRPGAPPLALVSISSVHWSDGGALDMARIATAASRKAPRCWSTPRTMSACAAST